MKILPTSCAVVVFLAVLACRVDATIIALTKGTGTPGTLTAMDVSRLTEYDLTSAKNKIPDALYVRDNNDLILPTTSAAMLNRLTLENSFTIKYNPTINITALHLGESIFANIDALYVTADSIVTPEPATIAVLGLGSLFLLRKRKGV